MKYLITESQHQTVLLETISTYLRRRMYMDVMKGEMDDIIENHLDPCDFKNAGDFVAEACDVMTYGYLEDLNASAKDTDSFYYHMVDLFGDYLVKVYNKNCGNKNMVTESKMSQVIYDYLDEMFPKEQVMLASPYSFDDDGNEYIDKCGINFYFEGEVDNGIFRWYDKCYWSEEYKQGKINRENSPMIEVESPYEETLISYFGDKWEEPFKQWFSDRYKLPVKKII